MSVLRDLTLELKMIYCRVYPELPNLVCFRAHYHSCNCYSPMFVIVSEVIRTFGKNLLVAYLKQRIKYICFIFPFVDIGPRRTVYNGLSLYIL